MMRVVATAMTILVGLAGVAGGSADRAGLPAGRVDVGVIVEETAGASAAARTAARGEVARLRERGLRAELRLARTPSEALASAATLATRGADRLVLVGVDPVVLKTLTARLGRVRLDVRDPAISRAR